MKKYVLVLAFAIFSVGFLGFGKSAFAESVYDNGLFDSGITIDDSGNFSLIDNNINNSTSNLNNSFTFVLSEPLKLNGLDFLIRYVGSGVVTVKFYDENNNILSGNNITFASSSTFVDAKKPFISTNTPVKKFVISSPSSFTLFEIELKGDLSNIRDGIDNHKPVTNVIANPTIDSVSLNWKNSSSTTLQTILVNGKDIGKVENYKFTDLKPLTKYDYVITAVYSDGIKVDNTISTTTLGDTVPPNDVFNLKAEPSLTNVVLSYDLPADDDYYYSEIYRNDKLIATVTDAKEYVDSGLKEDTVYKYTIYTFDKSLNKSNGAIVNVKTKFFKDDVPPEKIDGLTISPYSGGATVTWNLSSALDLKGYNIYLNGVLFNDDLITSNSFRFTNLKNEKNYQVYVTAVDASGNESEATEEQSFMPTIKAVPPVDIGNKDNGYKLADISESTGNWFKSMWLIVAFAIGIVLAFIVGHRVRNLFLG